MPKFRVNPWLQLNSIGFKKVQFSIEKFYSWKELEKTQIFFFNLNIKNMFFRVLRSF